MFARVAFPIPHDWYFTYQVPEDLLEFVRPGAIVTAPLGRKPAAGVVLEISEDSDIPLSGIKKISGPGDPQLTIPVDLLKLVKLTAARYASTPGLAAKSMLPPGSLQRKKLYLYPGHREFSEDGRREIRELVEKVRTMPGRLAAGDLRGYAGIGPRDIDFLIQRDVLSVSPFRGTSRERSSRKWVKAVVDTIPGDVRKGTKGYRLLEKLIEADDVLSAATLAKEGFSSGVLSSLSRKGYIDFEFREREIADIGSMKHLVSETVIELTLWQRAALEKIESSMTRGTYKGFLLYGVTSSGKTQVYIEAARAALSRGKSVLILVPEISLTPQIVTRFERSAGVAPLVWHSQLTPLERELVYKKARRGEAKLVIGARSAVFCPLIDLGLIVVDEEQDGSYKQDDPAPRYNGRDLALERGRLSGSTVLLGSATPSAESFYAARNGELEYLTLPQRVAGKKLPKIEIISTASGQQPKPEFRTVFPPGYWPVSERMHTELSIRLRNREQVIVLLNRRGYSSSVVCFECGWLGKCPDCEIGWTYHKNKNRMICHFCGAEQPGPSVCPECGSTRLSFRGAGTERLEEVLNSLFPEARITRLDSDAAAGKWESRDILDEFGKGKIDILLGTQMVAKGHHFPSVGFVGVVGADVGLSLPDFRASERVLQLLIQAAGRAGRSSRKSDSGLVMIQSFNPEHILFHYLLRDDYTGFLDYELKARESLQYPPFVRLILIMVSSNDSRRGAEAASRIKEEISGELGDSIYEILGPARAAIFKRGRQSRYQVMLKVPANQEIKKITGKISEISRGGKGYSVRIDVDPLNFL